MRNLAESFSLTVVSLKSESAAEYLKHFIFFLNFNFGCIFFKSFVAFHWGKKKWKKKEWIDKGREPLIQTVIKPARVRRVA